MDEIKSFLQFDLLNIGKYEIKVINIMLILLVFLLTKFLIWLIKLAIFRKRGDEFDHGNAYAIFQIVKYVVWIISIGLILDSIGVKVTVLIAGSAALLVGVGLGLQQTFNDIISGIILLSERSIKIDDILEIDGDVVMIQKIGLRTSKGLNRDEISIIIPNSLITTNKVINWSHQARKTRFRISVGVAYGSDVDLVMKLLRESALEHPEIIEADHVEGRFINFGNSSLDFQLLFFSENVFRIEKVKSEIRKNINRKFIENGINIPFPQMDIHLRSDDTKKLKDQG
ncbi:mechanosensitive ion channel [Draconibacterium sp.]|jgi:small-conductance mechanosensitive channel